MQCNTEQEEGRRATDKGKNFQRRKRICIGSKGAGASEAPGQTKEEFSANDTSRHPKLFKIGPQYG